MSISENIAAIRREIHLAAAKTGRTGADITLVGASKMNDAAACREAIAAGIDVLGENRVQEMTQKLAENAYDGVPLHFIGHLQRNKVKQIVGLAQLIHSVDSVELMSAISREAEKKGIVQDILLEVNVAGEASKSGIAPENLPELLEKAGDFPGLRVRGLMAVPPICRFPDENLPYFNLMHQLFIDNGAKKYDNVVMDFMSMGMSGDYQAAISCGANMIRLGTAIFGKRLYPEKKA